MYAPTTRSQRAVRFAIATAMVMAGALVGAPQAPPGLSPTGDQTSPRAAQCEALPTLVGEVEGPGGGAR